MPLFDVALTGGQSLDLLQSQGKAGMGFLKEKAGGFVGRIEEGLVSCSSGQLPQGFRM